MYDLHHTTMSALPFEKKEKQAIIFIGIQACGKTTFYHRMLSDGNYVHKSEGLFLITSIMWRKIGDRTDPVTLYVTWGQVH